MVGRRRRSFLRRTFARFRKAKPQPIDFATILHRPTRLRSRLDGAKLNKWPAPPKPQPPRRKSTTINRFHPRRLRTRRNSACKGSRRLPRPRQRAGATKIAFENRTTSSPPRQHRLNRLSQAASTRLPTTPLVLTVRLRVLARIIKRTHQSCLERMWFSAMAASTGRLSHLVANHKPATIDSRIPSKTNVPNPLPQCSQWPIGRTICDPPSPK